MRRGHTGIGGWRNENTRHFRPRGGGNQQFRPRDYQPIDVPRFSPPITRGFRPPLFASRLSHTTDNFPGRNRNKSRYISRNNVNRTYDTHNERQVFQQPKHYSHSELTSPTKRNKDTNNYDNSHQSNACHINSHGDIDLRQPSGNTSHLGHRQHSFTPWAHPPDHKLHHYDERIQSRQYKYIEDGHKLPYPGHRPPSSDHYGGNPTSIIENSKTYNRTVDDTVNIIRKRILDRNESLHMPDNVNIDNSNNNSFLPEESFGNFYDTHQEQPIRRRIQRQKQKNKSNCDKIKNKIVHQLFKMDKEKIHKLMDNPNSSSKFEYAISSLITESQNSYNRHLRSVAEKSLCGASTEFIQDDHNTIYEDTFLKQMQCILDPQDTVFLEDIKPFVMAELSKVLNLEDFEQQHIDSESSSHTNTEQFGYDEYPSSSTNYENYLQEYSDIPIEHQANSHYHEPDIQRMNKNSKNFDLNDRRNNTSFKPNFGPRQRAKSCSYNEVRDPMTEDVRFARHSLDNKSNDTFKAEEVPVLFDPNSKSLSEDEDPFAELDNQYHVAVDPNFIADDTSNSQHSQRDSSAQHLFDNTYACGTENEIDNVKQEIDSQILNIAKSPLKLNVKNNVNNDISERENINSNINQNTDAQSVSSTDYLHAVNSFTVNEICVPGENNVSTESKTSHTSSTSKSLRSSNSRKRPIDQQSSHRKEKRKKLGDPPDPKKKKESSNVTNLPAKRAESQIQTEKKTHKTKCLPNKGDRVKISEKGYSNKYVRRKNRNKPEKHTNESRKKNTPSSHSSLAVPNNTGTITPPKTDPKNTLKTIDMFIQKPKKVQIHQAHRNTAVVPSTKHTSSSEKDDRKKKDTTRKILQRDATTQVHTELVSKNTQTTLDVICTRCSLSEDTRLVEKPQMDPVHIATEPVQSLNPLARMKEIDLQIQNLVEEKLKLYRSLGMNEPSEDSLQSLGIALLNMPEIEEESKDEGVEKVCLDFTEVIEEVVDIPISDLVVLENENTNEVHSEPDSEAIDNSNNTIEPSKGRKLTRRQMSLQDRKKSFGPRLTKKVKKDKSPNISLIEQILKDDRPLEEIITLDDFEKPMKSRRKSQRVQRTKKKIIKTPNQPINLNDLNIIEIRDCSVVLVKEDLDKLLAEYNTKSSEEEVIQYEPLECASFVEAVEIPEKENSDIQLDMLDVSEDIIIDNNYEDKSAQDKDLEIAEVSISEEVILGDSQSSEDSLIPMQSGENECKTFDFAADENLRRDSINVTGQADAVLAIECIDNNFVAACLDGNVYYFSGDGQLINTLKGSNLAVTCLTIVKDKYETTIYTGSLDSRIRYYDLETGIEKGPECNVLSPIQTMDRAWDTVFVGTRTGFVLQFECKNNMLIPVSTVKFSDQSILALRAMKEGPRKVLLVASRAENVTIKDAQTGLLLRTLEGPKMTVYTLLYEDGKVYCGTSNHQIQVFDYTSGSHVGVHEGGKGAVCLRACGGLLFAGCYDGCVYVYREGAPRPLAQIRGPGLMLLSLAILGTKIIAGFKDRSLCIWKIPLSILQEMIL